jgi:apyrase
MVVIDAGSSGSRAHIFYYQNSAKGSLPVVQLPQDSHKITPGLSSFADEPELAQTALTDLVSYARDRVPQERWQHTPIMLLATAGMRMIPRSQAEQVLKVCRRELASSGFLFREQWASVISGQDEGVYAWVAANYASGALRTVRPFRCA